MTVLHEQVEGTRWLVSHCSDPVFILVTPAPPPYASAELAAAMDGALEATIAGHCGRCEAVAEDDGLLPIRRSIPHAPWCAWSAETVDRLHAACRPPAMPGGYSDADDEAERVCDYLRDLVASLGGEGPEDFVFS